MRQIRVEIMYIGVSTIILSGSIRNDGNECTRARGIRSEKTIEKTSNGRVRSVHHCVVAVWSTKRRRVVESERKRRKREREGREGGQTSECLSHFESSCVGRLTRGE